MKVENGRGASMGASMSEAEWNACPDPAPMLEVLHDRITDRKERLFLVACARSVWDRLEVPDLRKAVEDAERFADGLVGTAQMLEHREALLTYVVQAPNPTAEEWYTRSPDNQNALALIVVITSPTFGKESLTRSAFFNIVSWLTGPLQPDLLREIFGPLPFRNIPFPSEWRSPHVTGLAAAIYEDRAYDRFPLLADSLMDAGCFDEGILNHCRQPEGHVRGCWVVDLILGKV